jgi:hypothetical protein
MYYIIYDVFHTKKNTYIKFHIIHSLGLFNGLVTIPNTPQKREINIFQEIIKQSKNDLDVSSVVITALIEDEPKCQMIEWGEYPAPDIFERANKKIPIEFTFGGNKNNMEDNGIIIAPPTSNSENFEIIKSFDNE